MIIDHDDYDYVCDDHDKDGDDSNSARKEKIFHKKHETKGILRGDDDNCHPHHQYMNMMMNIR